MAGKIWLKITAGAVVLSLIAGVSSFYSFADDLSDYQKRQKELDERAAQYQAVIDSTASELAQREEYKAALQSKITVLNQQIISGRDEIASLDAQITQMQADIDESRSKISGRIDKLKQRVRALYVSGDTTSLEIILGAKDFGDFLDKLEIITYISKSDEVLISELQKDIDVINVKRDALKDTKTTLANEQKLLSQRQTEMQKLMDENQLLIDHLFEEKTGAQDHLDETNEERKVVEEHIQAYFKNKAAQEETARKAEEARKKLEAEKKAASEKAASEKAASEKAASEKAASEKAASEKASSEKAASEKAASEKAASEKAASEKAARERAESERLAQEYEEQESDIYYEEHDDYDDSSSQTVTSVPAELEPEPVISSGYVWPVPGHYELSSVWNEDRTTYNHGAIDISDGSIMNATVVAAESGVVVLSNDVCDHNYAKDGSCGCGGGYGKYLMIDHGDGKATLYAHLTSLTVSTGDYVQKGQVIGYVGTTGWSTGPHLHFETRLNGEKYNPMTEYPDL
ncbi:MAG: peptidoglycan DD-metalloendopeptidase family protein [Clostridia bacterium]|nr:peptidoglycan DD-metalloendopeptidase family protein [Clostridia bacterium]